jgi:hypothetical protein
MKKICRERRAVSDELKKTFRSTFFSFLTAHSSQLTASFALLILMRCAGGTGVGTPGIQANNGLSAQIYGKVTDSAQNLIPGGQVSLIPVRYHAPSPYDTSSQPGLALRTGNITNGRYFFTNIDTGWYNLEADNLLGKKALVESLYVDSATDSLPTCALADAGSIFGVLSYSGRHLPESTFVYLTGTAYYAYADSAGQFQITGVPAGPFTLGFDYRDTIPGISITEVKNYRVSQTVYDTALTMFIAYGAVMSGTPLDTAKIDSIQPQTVPRIPVAPDDTTYIYITTK